MFEIVGRISQWFLAVWDRLMMADDLIKFLILWPLVAVILGVGMSAVRGRGDSTRLG